MKRITIDFNPMFEKIDRKEIENRLKNNPTSFTNWYPQIKNIVKTPISQCIDISYDDFGNVINLFDNIPLPNKTLKNFNKIVKKIKDFGTIYGYPLFIKSYTFSSKHNWENTCFIDKNSDILKHITNIIMDSELVNCESGLGFVIRKFIDTSYSPFTAFEGMPVVKERRYFIKNKKVYGRQEYWVEGAFKNQNLTPKQWKQLRGLNLQTKEEILYLKSETEKIIKVLDGDWSVDWLMDSKGQWWCIDLAEMHKSYISETMIKF